MNTKLLKQVKAVFENSNRIIKLNLKADYFLIKEQKESQQALLEMNNAMIELINQNIEAERLGITLTN